MLLLPPLESEESFYSFLFFLKMLDETHKREAEATRSSEWSSKPEEKKEEEKEEERVRLCNWHSSAFNSLFTALRIFEN